MKVLVRKAGLDELETLLQWRMRVLQEVFSAETGTNVSGALYANNKRYYEQHLADGSYTACFATDSASGKILGCGGICYQEEMPSPDNTSGTNGYLMNIYSVPECRGQGIGRQIIEFLIQDAKSRGTEKIYLESSDMAKQLYYEIGFSDMKNYMQLRA